jgi:hypothetical protein
MIHQRWPIEGGVDLTAERANHGLYTYSRHSETSISVDPWFIPCSRSDIQNLNTSLAWVGYLGVGGQSQDACFVARYRTEVDKMDGNEAIPMLETRDHRGRVALAGPVGMEAEAQGCKCRLWLENSRSNPL